MAIFPFGRVSPFLLKTIHFPPYSALNFHTDTGSMNIELTAYKNAEAVPVVVAQY